ncbi:MAG TPA: ABC transporter permease [Candidatus Methylomirabilis sp.]|nr:ABC transporter permease [Candidatus Methylomirabilis sp.]
MSDRPPALVIGSTILAVMVAVSLLAPWIAPYAATEQHILKRLERPSPAYLLGTDQYGRDLLSRTLMGGRTALLLGVGAVLLGLAVGVPVGLAAGYFGGRADDAIMRIVDAMLSFPSLLLALLIITALGASTAHALAAIGIANVPGIARIVRGNTLALREAEFVLAARARGEGHVYVMFGEILPNVLPAIVVETTIRVGFAMLAAASLSFLGLGVQPPTADWGLMIREARQYVFLSPWPLVAPGVALSLTIIGLNLFGDGLRDRLGGGS